ncbi:nuclear transport factor 2 family protein [Calidithermus roseus]|uniref:SnoaL-like domain protein n=1 Tax=Calidithermus roseus TaxID=1644118 RepID=A0A399ER42_9DEIN|nr:nuclear transport factor 2 family protein [Calidithermus roseus]RIH85499.1 SnoaL-like domain protein [Calidithermus roseus]
MGSAVSLKRESLEHWLRRLGQAWESADAELAASLFDPEVLYQENPFDPPIRGFEAVKRYWLEGLATQRDVKFEGEVLAVEGNVVVVNWRVEFTRVPGGERVRLDGVSVGRFSAEGRPLEWREWWHREELGHEHG